MSGAQRLVLASNNAGKIREFGALLRPTGFDVVAQHVLGVSEAEEPYGTFVENALAKARHAAQATGLPALADDSGLVVPALGGAPGVYSARYAALAGGEKSDAANNARLLAELDRLGDAGDRHGFYYCVLVMLRDADDPCPLIAEGIWHGVVLDTPRGSNGFGYDPYFMLPGLGLSAAELAPAEKNRISHRGQALASLLARLSAGAA